MTSHRRAPAIKAISLALVLPAILLLAAHAAGPACTPPSADNAGPDSYQQRRAAMVTEQIAARGITDPAVLAAMNKVPRHEFVPADMKPLAYTDQPLPIGNGQTISQPYIVAFMTQALELKPGDKVLEIGTGSGYQAAVLAETAGQVYSIEIIRELSERARETLDRLGYARVITRCGDGYKGWPEHAPFDAVIVTAAPDHVPQPLVDQLAVGGRMVIPVGDHYQELLRITKTRDGIKKEKLLPVRFVPMTGEAQKPGSKD
ncbi:MAG TPA: protein-L-isoaspartate(D-aspartate) O-methyltransferase [bacterium]|nr:protein-L-isoaspartate(D-aspartate) O-methyltransferase [bacterium]